MREPPAVIRLRSVRATTSAPRSPRGPGFDVAFLRPEPIGGGMDPFLQVDAFALAEPVFAPHPHAGFSAVTYIFPESPIGFINRDSRGMRNRIGPGALHWTMAGSGILHEEVPELLGTAALGLQIFVNLPAALRHAPPRALHAGAEALPVATRDGATIRAVVGESNGIASPITAPTPGVRLIDVSLAPGAAFEQALDARDNAFLWLFEGTAAVVTPSDEHPVATFDHVGFANDGSRLRVLAGSDGARLILFAGTPLAQPIAARGPFVMPTTAELDAAFERYRRGEMGTLSRTSYDADGRPEAADD